MNIEISKNTEHQYVTITLANGDDFFDLIINPDMIIDMRHEKGIGQDYEIIMREENVSSLDIEEYFKNHFN